VARKELIVGLANLFFPNATRYLEIGCGNGAVLHSRRRADGSGSSIPICIRPALSAHEPDFRARSS
jgi:hypothetical protein